MLGTTSGAGKSTLVAAICRFLSKKGVRVAPFKAQNMSLNACAVRGGEMAWAQVVQAQAAGVEPEVTMNPVLLKPLGDSRSELILMGKSSGVVESATFDSYKAKARPVAYQALEELLSSYQLVVAEGAGSPVEVNLKDMDFVNTGLMREFKAATLLVADIDRGGVFASLLGTLLLLSPEERDLLEGVVINRFRGNLDILKPGLDFLERETGKPVFGVIPYLREPLPPEDSLDLMDSVEGGFKVAVVRYPRISNFSDLSPLVVKRGISLFYTCDPLEVASADLVILPGSRATLDDLRWLKEVGLDLAVKLAHKRGAWVLGICGGFQMLGEVVEDPVGTDGGGRERGLELLPARSTMLRKKLVMPVTAKKVSGPPWLPQEVDGYEIHTGVTTGCEPLFLLEGGRMDGGYAHRVLGTYIHDLLAHDGFRRAFFEALGVGKPEVSYRVYLEERMENLAEIVEKQHLLASWLEEMAGLR